MGRGTDKPDYGFDGNPRAMIITLSTLSAADVVLFILFRNAWKVIPFVLLGVIAVFALMTGWWFSYVKIGKLRHRDAILSMIDWKGNETVLDIGTGRGLLMIGAAEKLDTGRCIGIDIWREQDMMNNASDRTLANARLEGVSDRIEIRDEDIRNTNFKSEYFDVILSNLCLHNISPAEERQKACKEIARLLKPKGTAVISDGFHIREYVEVFRQQGLSARIVKAKFPWRDVWLHTVVVKKD